jgi:uncharacterized membrane protein
MTRTLGTLLLVCALSGCATIQSVASSKETFVACQVIDTATTYVALSKTGFVEKNPLMAALLKHGWLPFIGLKIAVIWITYNASLSPLEQTVVNAISCVPGIWNTHLLTGQ